MKAVRWGVSPGTGKNMMEGSPNGSHTPVALGRWRVMVINRSPLIPTHLTSYPVCRLGPWVLVPDRWTADGERRAGYLSDGSERVSLAHSCDILVEFVQALHRVEDLAEAGRGGARAAAPGTRGYRHVAQIR